MSSDDYLNSNSAFPGGLLTSKPTWWNAFGCSATSAFLSPGIWARHKSGEELRCTPTI